jgi:hypothetical protein
VSRSKPASAVDAAPAGGCPGSAGGPDGFDLSRHPISLLSLGSLGWIQIANFVVTGGLYVACAVGMWRALRPGRNGTWGPCWSVPSGSG